MPARRRVAELPLLPISSVASIDAAPVVATVVVDRQLLASLAGPDEIWFPGGAVMFDVAQCRLFKMTQHDALPRPARWT